MGPGRPARRPAVGAARPGARGTRACSVGRITIEILRPVPLAPLTVASRVVRPGRSVELRRGRAPRPPASVASRARRAWRLRTGAVASPRPTRSRRRPGRTPGAERRSSRPARRRLPHRDGLPLRRRRLLETGPATVWMRMRHPLVAGEAPSPLARVLVAADSGNGVSARARLPALPVHQHRADRAPHARAGRRVGLPRRGDAPGRRTASGWPRPCCSTSAAGSAAPRRRCSCARALKASPRRRRAGRSVFPGGGDPVRRARPHATSFRRDRVYVMCRHSPATADGPSPFHPARGRASRVRRRHDGFRRGSRRLTIGHNMGDAMSTLVGTCLNGRYRLDAQIGAGRDVDGLSRVRHDARAPGRGQAHAPRDRVGLRPARALPPRGALRRPAQPPAHRRRDRRRRGGRAPLHRLRVRRGRDAQGPHPPHGPAARSTRRSPTRSRSPARSAPRTRAASSTATSSRRTSSSTRRARPRSPTSASPARSRRRG